MSGKKQNNVQIEISVEKLESLFNKGELCANDFTCLSEETKKSVWNLCITSCARRVQCDYACFKCRVYGEQSAQKTLKNASIDIFIKQKPRQKHHIKLA